MSICLLFRPTLIWAVQSLSSILPLWALLRPFTPERTAGRMLLTPYNDLLNELVLIETFLEKLFTFRSFALAKRGPARIFSKNSSSDQNLALHFDRHRTVTSENPCRASFCREQNRDPREMRR